MQLSYCLDNSIPGISRKKEGDETVFLDSAGKAVTEAAELDRIRKLAIPPAWTDVWISPYAHSHLQATGRDAKIRKQYIYHPLWRRLQSDRKFHQLLAFGNSLPAIRRKTAADARARGIPRRKVLAVIVILLDKTLIRIGGKEYVRKNRSYGLSTLRGDHLSVYTDLMHFHFHGKGGKEIDLSVRDPRLARIIRRLSELSGQKLFQYYDGRNVHREVDSSEVNEYLSEIARGDFTAKDFRTWGGTVIAATALHEMGPPLSERDAIKKISKAVETAAGRLVNRPATCLKYYIHPAVMDAYRGGSRGRGGRSEAGREGDYAPAGFS